HDRNIKISTHLILESRYYISDSTSCLIFANSFALFSPSVYHLFWVDFTFWFNVETSCLAGSFAYLFKSQPRTMLPAEPARIVVPFNVFRLFCLLMGHSPSSFFHLFTFFQPVIT